MIDRIELTEDYSIARTLNGLWQLSPGHTINDSIDLEDVNRAFHMLVEAGFTTFDLADIYTGAEEALGRFLKELDSHSDLTKDDIQIHEKYVPDAEILKTVTFSDTEAIIDRSLKKLGRDYIDLMQFHWWDYDIPRYIEVAEHLVKLQGKGKIRHIGVTNFNAERLNELVQAGIPVISSQSQYSMFDRRPEKNLLSYSDENNIQQICFGTLSGGLLSEKYLGLTKDKVQAETRSQIKYMQVIDETLGYEGFQELLELLNDLAAKYHVNIANVATRYIMQQENVAATIIGVRSSRHVASNRQVYSFELTAADEQAIRQLLDQYPDLEGDCYDLERDPDSVFSSIIRRNENAKG